MYGHLAIIESLFLASSHVFFSFFIASCPKAFDSEDGEFDVVINLAAETKFGQYDGVSCTVPSGWKDSVLNHAGISGLFHLSVAVIFLQL